MRTLRDDTIPRATRNADMTASVGGTTAGYVDLADEISSRLVLTIAVVVALSFVLLLLAFRSVVIPLTAGLMNLVSIGAAFGVVSAVFEKGWGVGVVGLDESGGDRQLRAADDVRDPLRALDGLRGLPDDAHQGGLGAHARQHAAR